MDFACDDQSRNCELQEESPPCQLAKLHQYLIGIEGFYVNVFQLPQSGFSLSAETPFLSNDFKFSAEKLLPIEISPLLVDIPVPRYPRFIYSRELLYRGEEEQRRSLHVAHSTDLPKRIPLTVAWKRSLFNQRDV